MVLPLLLLLLLHLLLRSLLHLLLLSLLHLLLLLPLLHHHLLLLLLVHELLLLLAALHRFVLPRNLQLLLRRVGICCGCRPLASCEAALFVLRCERGDALGALCKVVCADRSGIHVASGAM